MPTPALEVQQSVRRRLLRGFVRRGLPPEDDAQATRAMATRRWFLRRRRGAHRGHGLRRARAATAQLSPAHRSPGNRLHEVDPEHLLYEAPPSGPGSTKALRVTPLQLLDRLAALVPPPRTHRHRYYGVLAPNAPLRAAVTALAPVAVPTPPAPAPDAHTAEPAHRRAARNTWALLLARIYTALALLCPKCGAEMRIIAFIIDAPTVRQILTHLGEPTTPPRVAPARGPPLWDLPAAGAGDGDPLAQPAPEYEFDQRIVW